MTDALQTMRGEYCRALFHDQLRLLVILMGYFTVGLGCLFLFGHEFFADSEVYRFMARWERENAWGAFMVSVGTLKWIVLGLNPYLRRSNSLLVRLIPAALNGLMCAVWLLLSVGAVVTDWHTPYTIFYSGLFLGTWWVTLRRGAEALLGCRGA